MEKILCSHILSEVEKGKWNEVQGKQIINIQGFPFSICSNVSFTYIKLTIEKETNTYKGSVTFESEISYMRQKEEEGEEDFDDINQQTFFTASYTKLVKCVSSMVKTLGKISTCNSCNNIYEKINDTNLCMNCAIQLFVEKPQTECSICMDESAFLLPYTLKCGHTFHFSCLAKMKHYKCPLCRRDFAI
jgi:hypothetical protein